MGTNLDLDVVTIVLKNDSGEPKYWAILRGIRYIKLNIIFLHIY